MIRKLLLVAFVPFCILPGFAQNTSSAFVQAGLAKVDRGDNKGAVKCYNIALEYNSSNTKAYLNRGVAEAALRCGIKSPMGFCDQLRTVHK